MLNTIKKILVIIICVTLISTLIGCNKQLVDLTYKFDRAIISLPDGSVVEGKVDSWTDFEDGDQLQVKIDGVTYFVHSSDIVLIKY